MDDQIEICVSSGAIAGRAQGGRPSQQDDFICLHDPISEVQLLVLADGLGGHGAGEIASQGVIETAQRLWKQETWRELPGSLFLESICQQAHTELRRRGETLAEGVPHSTIVALLLKGPLAYWAHVGDSRLYYFQGQTLLGQTRDHSVTQHKVDHGQLDASQSGGDADQYGLLRGLGGAQAPEVDHGSIPLRRDLAFVLCSDGIWAHLSASELGHFSRKSTHGSAAREALSVALKRGGEDADNATLIFAWPTSAAGTRGRMSRWFSKLLGRVIDSIRRP